MTVGVWPQIIESGILKLGTKNSMHTSLKDLENFHCQLCSGKFMYGDIGNIV